jgi:TonB family protein
MKELLLIAVFLAPLFGPLQTRTGSVAGQLLSKDGQPAAGIRVSAMAVPDSTSPSSTTTTLVSFVVTDSAGRYRLDNIPAGRYYVTAGLVELPTYYPGVPSLSAATTVNVAVGATVTGIDFTMAVPAGVTVSGRVIFPPSQQPVTPIRRAALTGGGMPAQETALGADGSFQFLRVRPGTYNLILNIGAPSQPFSVSVTDKEITGLEIVVPLTVNIAGTVNVEGGGPLPRLTLSFASYKGGVTAPFNGTSNQGQFRAQLPEGEYRVSWLALPAGYNLKSITAGSMDLVANPLKVAAGSPPPPLVVTLGVAAPPPWVKVSGRIIGLQAAQTGVPYQMMLMGGLGAATMDTLPTTVNADGSFEFPKVLPGSYAVRFSLAVPIPPTSLTVGNKDLSGVEIALPTMKVITGRVTIEGLGQVTPRLNFTLADSSGTAPATAVGQPDGTFRLTLPDGERRLTLNVPGYSVKALSYGSVDLLREPLVKISSTDSAQFQVVLVALAAGVGGGAGGGVVGGGAGGFGGGTGTNVPGGVLGGILGPTQVPQVINRIVESGPPPPLPPQRIGGDVAQANLLTSVAPVYPPLARAASVQGYVMLQAIIDKEGKVANLTVLQGHPLLNEAAIEAVRQWRYRPQVLVGQPIEVITTITVNFSFQ